METNTPTNTAGIERLQKAEREFLDATFAFEKIHTPELVALKRRLKGVVPGTPESREVVKEMETLLGGPRGLVEFMVQELEISSRVTSTRLTYVEIRGALQDAGVI